MALNKDKAFEVNENGIVLTDNDCNVIGYFSSGTGSPIGNSCPVPTFYTNSSGQAWINTGTGPNDWVQLGSSAPTPVAFTCFRGGNSINVLPGSGIDCARGGDSSVI